MPLTVNSRVRRNPLRGCWGTTRLRISDSLMEGDTGVNVSSEGLAGVAHVAKQESKTQKAMKKLLLIALAISGLALVPAQLSNAETPTAVLVPRTGGLSFGFPSGYQAYPRYLNYYPYGYYRHPYVHYYLYAGNAYSYYSAPPSHRYSGHRTYRHHRHDYHHSY